MRSFQDDDGGSASTALGSSEAMIEMKSVKFAFVLVRASPELSSDFNARIPESFCYGRRCFGANLVAPHSDRVVGRVFGW
ncbi:hypothetical protein COP1_003693 [Malus domestica]